MDYVTYQVHCWWCEYEINKIPTRIKARGIAYDHYKDTGHGARIYEIVMAER